jgi:hypothetical protein
VNRYTKIPSRDFVIRDLGIGVRDCDIGQNIMSAVRPSVTPVHSRVNPLPASMMAYAAFSLEYELH